ncbi:MAG TPA: hypothetical protein VGE15_09945 [Sphingobacteriaceae bacterium]
MKKSLQLTLLVLALSACQAAAQTINAIGDFPQPVNAVACEGEIVTLTASKDAGGGLEYAPDQYEWIEVTNGNTPVSEPSGTLVLSGLLPGRHTYKVRGTVTSTSTCTGDFEEFTFYVLPALDVKITSSGDATGNIFCSDELPLTVQLSAAVTPRQALPLTFGYTYQWYKVDGATETAISDANSSTYAVNAFALGSTSYKLRTSYKVDATCSFDSAGGIAAAVDIIVKPRPVKPTITFSKS